MGYSVIGKSYIGPDVPPKATGTTKFTDDLPLPGMLHGKILRSPYPHARIVRIDVSQALKHPGIQAVITGADLPPRKYGLAPNVTADRFPLAQDRARFVGEEIAALAAVDEDTAEEALGLIEVEYEEIPAVFDPEEALKPESPIIHGENNVCGRVAYQTGDASEALDRADYVREDFFRVEAITHAAIEPHAALASFDPLGNLTLWTSTQTATWVRSVLAPVLGISEERVRVIAPAVGGAFGGKSGVFGHEICAALLARATGRPVKMVCSREEVFSATIRRHATSVRLKIGVSKDGTILAMKCRVVAESGAYANMGPASISYTAAFLTAPYLVPNVDFEAYRVYNNRTVCGPQRGPGTPPIRFAVESILDRVAADLGLDPAAIRLKNALTANYTTPSQLRITSCGLAACIKEATGAISPALKPGLACSAFMSGYNLPPYVPCPSVVKVEQDGSVSVFVIHSDFGQGADTGVQQIVAEELGLPVDAVRVRSGDTALVPDAWWSFADTFAIGNAARSAAIQVKHDFFRVVAEHLEARPEDLVASDGRIFIQGSPQSGMSFVEAARLHLRRTKRPATALAQYCANTDMLHVGQRNVSRSYSFAAQSVMAEVDRETGQTDIKRFVTAYDCGRALNPIIVEGTLEGAVVMGQGQAISESMEWRDGHLLNPSFLDYKVPTALDAPGVKPVLIETVDPEGPFGAKEVGQGSLQAAAPAVANAVNRVAGIWLDSLPIKPEAVLAALGGVPGMGSS
ncbi:MAG: xanthine dehydrogenase family protein molybdopterin-binding subunit [Dehalococcoidia bacterium]|nr:xanthine dehydrogenase family protein molybdopterin-binding subunit [Dehalococcoidia bacterium]